MRILKYTLLLIIMLLVVFNETTRKKKPRDGGHEIATVMFTHKTPNGATKPNTYCVPWYVAQIIPENKSYNALGFHAGVKTWK